MADLPVDANYGHSIDDNASTGAYQGQKTISTLKLTTQRDMNGQAVKCVLENDETKFDEHNLSVTCKYFLVHEYQMGKFEVLF